jgi:hypothetical protein
MPWKPDADSHQGAASAAPISAAVRARTREATPTASPPAGGSIPRSAAVALSAVTLEPFRDLCNEAQRKINNETRGFLSIIASRGFMGSPYSRGCLKSGGPDC